MNERVSDSENSGVDLLEEVDLLQTPTRKVDAREQSQPESVLSHRFRESAPKQTERRKTQERDSVAHEERIAVMVSPPSRPWEYKPFNGATTVDSVLGEFEGPDGEVWYKIEFEDGKKQDVSIGFVAAYQGTLGDLLSRLYPL
jgi:hypothetical protein